MRTKFVDKEQKRWDLNKVDGFMKDKGPDPLITLEGLGFNQNTARYSFKYFLKYNLVAYNKKSRILYVET